MSASDVAPLPRLGEVFFDVRGNSRTMRLSWYADTGVAVFSIWQGGTCTGTFRVPITDLPRLVDALQRGPAGAAAAGSPDVPGTGARQIQGHGAAGGPAPDAPGDPLTAGTSPAGYPAASPYTDAGQYGSVAGYGAPDRRAERSEPAAYGGYPEPGARGGHTEPAAGSGYTGTGEHAGRGDQAGGRGGYLDPAEPGGQTAAAAAGFRGYPDPGQAESAGRGGYPDPAPYGGYPTPDDHGRQPEASGYGAYPGEHGTQAEIGARGGYPDPAAYGGYPDPDDFGRPPEPPSRGGYSTVGPQVGPQAGPQTGPQTGEYSRATDPLGDGGYQPAARQRGYPDPGELGSQPGGQQAAAYSRTAPWTTPRTTEYSSPAEGSGSLSRGAYPAPASPGGYPGSGEHGRPTEPAAPHPYTGYPEPAPYDGYPDPGGRAGQTENAARGSHAEPGTYTGHTAPGEFGGHSEGYDRYPAAGLPPATPDIPPGPPAADYTSLMPAQPDSGPPTVGMTAVTGRSGGSSPAGSAPYPPDPYPPDPYLDGALPFDEPGDGPADGERSPRGRRSTAQERAPQRPAYSGARPQQGESGPRRGEDEPARELPYGYPPAVGR